MSAVRSEPETEDPGIPVQTFNGLFTHRVRVQSLAEIDDELVARGRTRFRPSQLTAGDKRLSVRRHGRRGRGRRSQV